MELEQRPPDLLTGPTSGSCRSRVADGKLETFDGFDVVGDHVRLGVDDRSNQVFLALEVRNQHRHEDARVAVFDLPDGPGEVGRTLVGEVVAVDAREDDVIEPDLGDGFPHVRGFVGVEWFHPPRLDVTEVTAPRAAMAHEHERGRTARVALVRVGAPTRPALPQIRTVGLLANGVEVVLAQRLPVAGELPSRRRSHLQPVGLSRATHIHLLGPPVKNRADSPRCRHC